MVYHFKSLSANDIRKRATGRKASPCSAVRHGGNHFRARPHIQAEHRRCVKHPQFHRLLGCNRWRPGMRLFPSEWSMHIYCDGPYSCAYGSHAMVIVTKWEQFQVLNSHLMKAPLLVDLGISSYEIEHHGYLYASRAATPLEHDQAPRLNRICHQHQRCSCVHSPRVRLRYADQLRRSQ
jgi:hypothetical protein